jgi:type I restriction enzyme S subunit
MSFKEIKTKLSANWPFLNIADYCNVITDYVANGSFKSLSDNVKYNVGENHAKLIRLTDYHNGFNGDFVTIDKKGYEFLKKSKLYGEEIIIANVGANVGTVFLAPKLNCRMSLGPNAIMLKTKGIDKFYYYWFKSQVGQNSLKSIITGSAQPKFNKTAFRMLKIPVPPIELQKKISDTLAYFDDKNEINNLIIKNLEELGQTLYKRWFVDFEFPNEEGKPYKSSGGEMVESELGMIPKDWYMKKHIDYFPVLTGKKNANIATRDGKYKFFTCSQGTFMTDNYSFEAEAILLAGNGEFNVKYFKGKFEAYQRTYVLIPKNSKLTGLLFFEIKINLSKLTKGSRGSVISFITKGQIEDYKIAMPTEDKLEKMSKIFENILMSIANLNNQNETLSKLRDLLLPKLMSGEIEVPDTEQYYGH